MDYTVYPGEGSKFVGTNFGPPPNSDCLYHVSHRNPSPTVYGAWAVSILQEERLNRKQGRVTYLYGWGIFWDITALCKLKEPIQYRYNTKNKTEQWTMWYMLPRPCLCIASFILDTTTISLKTAEPRPASKLKKKAPPFFRSCFKQHQSSNSRKQGLQDA